MTPENNTELLNQAEQAFANQEARQGLKFVLQILNADFTNAPAWRLLHRVWGGKMPFKAFRIEFAKKYFPDKVHLLMDQELATLQQASAPARIESPQSIAAPQPAPLEKQQASVSRIADIRFCPQCGQAREAGMQFCVRCGNNFSTQAEKKAEPARQTAQLAPIPDAWGSPLAPQINLNTKPLQPAPIVLVSPVIEERPIQKQVDRKALIRSLSSTDFNEVLYAIDQIRENKLTDLRPYLLEAADVPRHFRKPEILRKYVIAMTAALCAVFTPDMAKPFVKLVWRNQYWSSAPEFSRTLAAHGMLKEALAMVERSMDPAFNTPPEGQNLQCVLACGAIPSEDAVERLNKMITKEKKTYEPGLSGGYLVSFMDPISFLVTAALSVAYTVASNVIQHAAWDQAGQLNAMLMVAPQQLREDALKELPRPVILMLAYHTYATAFANIARVQPRLILSAVQNHTKGIQQAVLGMAMAKNRMAQAEAVLKQVVSDNHWAVRIVAYEGLILYAEQFNRMPDRMILTALKDEDIRVVLSSASAMIATGQPVYEAPILALAQVPDAKRRGACLRAVALLAGHGNTTARHVLKNAAQNDKSDKVREQAVEYLHGLG